MRRSSLTDIFAVTAAIIIVLAFFVSDMVTAAGWDWRAALARFRPKSAITRDDSEIRNYVEFVQTRHDDLTIITGIEFGSSYERKPAYQWCYAERADKAAGEPEYKLSLATKTASGTIQPNRFTASNLGPLGLSAAKARTLMTEQCRFR